MENGQVLRLKVSGYDGTQGFHETLERCNPEKVRVISLGELFLQTCTGNIRYLVFLGDLADRSYQGINVAAGKPQHLFPGAQFLGPGDGYIWLALVIARDEFHPPPFEAAGLVDFSNSHLNTLMDFQTLFGKPARERINLPDLNGSRGCRNKMTPD
jgi:hypothetical protein